MKYRDMGFTISIFGSHKTALMRFGLIDSFRLHFRASLLENFFTKIIVVASDVKISKVQF